MNQVQDPQNLARLLPHRPPFRLIDRLIEADIDAGHLVGERLLSAGDPLLLPEGVIAPLLLIEALCQAAACLRSLELLRLAHPAGAVPRRGYLVSAAGFEFPAPPHPGDPSRGPGPGHRLRLEVTRQGRRGPLVAFAAAASAGLSPDAGQEPVALCRGRLLFAVTAP